MKSKRKNKGKVVAILSIMIIIICLVFTIKKSNNSAEKLDDKKEFELVYNQNDKKELTKIIDKNSSEYYDFDIYTYGGDVLININDKSYDLKEALLQNIISVDDILDKAKNDVQNNVCTEGEYLDGGSIEYYYEDYTILKCHKEDIVKGTIREDFVIGMKKEILNKVDAILDEKTTLSDDTGWLENYK